MGKAISVASRIEVALTESTRIQRHAEPTTSNWRHQDNLLRYKQLGVDKTKVDATMRMYAKYVATVGITHIPQAVQAALPLDRNVAYARK